MKLCDLSIGYICVDVGDFTRYRVVSIYPYHILCVVILCDKKYEGPVGKKFFVRNICDS
jgi:hypothetical protein